MANLKAKQSAKSEQIDTSPKMSVAERVTQAILAQMESGTRPWVKPWEAGEMSFGLPLRSNGKPYRGINTLLLWAAATQHGFQSPYWLTFKGAIDAGGAVRKGEKGTWIVFYGVAGKKDESEDDDAKPDFARLFAKTYYVFNADQCDGLPESFGVTHDKPATTGPRPDLEALFAKLGADVRHGGNRAYNTDSGNYIQMPYPADFKTPELYYCTLAHEVAHWTGAPSRLNRVKGQRFGDERYAFEELVAELTSAFLGAHLGLPVDHLESPASYIKSWAQCLKEHSSAIISAASQAQKACDYILKGMGLDVDGGEA